MTSGAGAVVERRGGDLVAHVAWETAEDVLVPGSGDPAELADALRELQAVVQGQTRDNRRLLRALPLAERALQPGRADYYRSRVAQAFGYPQLALLAIEEALMAAPEAPGFVHQRLDLLEVVNLDRALAEARVRGRVASTPVVVLAACAGVYDVAARRCEEPERRGLLRELLEVTDRFEHAPGRATAPRDVVALLHVARGFALLHVGQQEHGLAELSAAVDANPDSAQALAARGLETYPSDDGIRDLERAVELDPTSLWPTYYLAHHYIQTHDWRRAEELSSAALRLEPQSPMRANLLEWQAIARFQNGGDLAEARAQFGAALELAPDNEHLRRNIAVLDGLASLDSAERVVLPWAVARDAEKRSSDVQAPA